MRATLVTQIAEAQAGLLRLPGPRVPQPGLSASLPAPLSRWRAGPSPAVPPSASAAAPCWLAHGQLASCSVLPPEAGRQEERDSGGLPLKVQIMGFPQASPQCPCKKLRATLAGGQDLSDMTQRKCCQSHLPALASTLCFRDRQQGHSGADTPPQLTAVVPSPNLPTAGQEQGTHSKTPADTLDDYTPQPLPQETARAKAPLLGPLPDIHRPSGLALVVWWL